MKRPFLFALFLNLGLVSCGLREEITKIETMCNHFGSPNFYLLLDKTKIKWSLKHAVSKGIVVGSGASGVVSVIPFDGSLIPKMSSYDGSRGVTSLAVKRMKITEETWFELKTTFLMSETKVGINFFGCQIELPDPKDTSPYADKHPYIYLVLDRLAGDMTSDESLKAHLAKFGSQRFGVYKLLFEQVIFFYRKGYLHNDIKPENMLWDDQQQMIKIIDFGLAQETDTTLWYAGTPIFMSPAKMLGRKLPMAKLVDDLYSLVLSIVVIENINHDRQIFTSEYGTYKPGCIKYKDSTCIRDITRNSIAILVRNGFESPKKSGDRHEKTAMFTQLCQDVLAYHTFAMSDTEVLDVLYEVEDRLKGTAKQVPKSVEKTEFGEAKGLMKKKEKARDGCGFSSFFTWIFGG